MQIVEHVNGETWLDTDGRPIQAHGGGMLVHDGVYYWFGENRDGPARQIGDEQRIDAVGISCYQSTDLLRWQNRGVVLPVVEDPAHDLHPTKVIERPKVIFNANTGKFVMWLHVDSPDYRAARVGVAVADAPTGLFRYIRSFRPNDFESRDQTLFQDSDGRAYHFCASDNNDNTMISLLSEDYLSPSGQFVKAFMGRKMEAFAVCKRQGRYWMLASGCTGWAPNAARAAWAENIMGPWTEIGNPCVGENAELTFAGQSAFIIPPGPACTDYVAMFDIWRPKNLRTSGYMWLPIEWDQRRPILRWRRAWQG